MAASPFVAPRILRIVGFVDFMLAIICIATPVLRSRIGDMPAYAFGTLLLVGSGMMFAAAQLLGRPTESVSISPVRSPVAMR